MSLVIMNPIFTAELATLHHSDLRRRDHYRTTRPGRKAILWRSDAKPINSI
jgi:hypothetical protein